MLLVSQDDTFKVTVKYLRREDGKIEILDADKEGQEKEEFEFRRPSWQDMRRIMRLSARSAEDIDPMAFVEAKVTTLLKSWSLKDKEGRMISLKEISSLPPAVMINLNSQIDKTIGIESLMGVMPSA